MDYLNQTEWYIHPITGDDSKDGNSEASALRSFKKLSTNWGKGNVLLPTGSSPFGQHRTVTVHILADLLPTDPLNFDVILNDQVDLKFVGHLPVKGPGYNSSKQIPVTSIIQRNRADNKPWELLISEEIDIGKRIMCQVPWEEGGFWGFNNLIMWSVKKVEQGKFRISEPICMPDVGFLKNEYRITPKIENNFYVQSLHNVTAGSMRVGSIRTTPSSPIRNRLFFVDLNINGDISPELDMGSELYCYGCSLKGSIQLAAGFSRNFVNCFQESAQTIRINSGLTRFMAGAYISTHLNADLTPNLNGSQGFLPTNCTTQLDFDVIFQNHSISIVAGNTLIIGTAGIFDSKPGGNGRTNMLANGIMVSAGSVTCRTLLDNTHHLWGSDQDGHGVGVSSGGRFYYVSNPPTIAGVKGHFSLGEAINTNNWSNLDAKGNARNQDFDAWILKTQ